MEKTYPHRYETQAMVDASAPAVFEQLDDHTRLSSHMEKSSWMMFGSRMELHLDDARGQAVGSRIRLGGRVLGIPLAVEEVITERIPPTRKVWETTGTPQLLVIGPYRMGFEITPAGRNARLRVFIEYALPRGSTRILGLLLGPAYARWCVRRMVQDAVSRFSAGGSGEQRRAV